MASVPTQLWSSSSQSESSSVSVSLHEAWWLGFGTALGKAGHLGWRDDVALRRDRNGYLVRSEVVDAGAVVDAVSGPFGVCQMPGLSIRFSVVLNDSSHMVCSWFVVKCIGIFHTWCSTTVAMCFRIRLTASVACAGV